MKNFIIFIFFGTILYFLSAIVVSWDDGDFKNSYQGAALNNRTLEETRYNWNEKFSFPESLYARKSFTPLITGRTFYVDPVHGSMTNDGSKNHPWKTLEEVFKNNLIQHYKYEKLPYKKGRKKILVNSDAPVKGGDALILLSGNHGYVNTGKNGFYMEGNKFLTIKAGLGSFPTISNIDLNSASYIFLSDIDFDGEFPKDQTPRAIINVSSHKHFGESESIIINNCRLASKGNSYLWNKKEWKENALSGVVIHGDNTVVRGCHIKNVALGISITGDKSLVIDNIVKNFCVDGLRGNGSDLVFQRNYVSDSYKVDDNHDDGFQSFLTAGKKVYKNVIIKDNMFIQSTDGFRKFLGTFQGIGCFDGPYENWDIVGNTVICDNWHGISLLGAIDSIIDNNTVLPKNYNAKEGPPWIAMIKSKSGEEPVNCSVINNQSMAYRLSDTVLSKNNITIKGRDEVETILKRIEFK